MIAMSDLLRLSLADLAYIAPDETFAAAAERWLSHGAKLIVLTKGSEGAEARTPSASAGITAPAASLIDAVGAGDAFLGALFAHLVGKKRLTKDALGSLDQTELRDALAFAAKAAAISLSRAGADPPWLREIR